LRSGWLRTGGRPKTLWSICRVSTHRWTGDVRDGPLELDELRRLLESATAGPQCHGMAGPERATLYRLAVETGLRANELRALKVNSFDLHGPTVSVEAAYSKHRRRDTLPLRPDMAEALRGFLAGKLPTARAFNMPKHRGDLVDMLRKDLAAAGIPYQDESGRYTDFHSLRHTCGSLLAAAGVHPKVAQTIMRHSDINLTMSRYTHVFKGQESAAVASLPSLSVKGHESNTAAATGTDGNASAPENLAFCLARQGGNQRISAGAGGQETADSQTTDNCSKRPSEVQKRPSKGPETQLPKEGIEPSPCCQDGILNPARLPIPPLRLVPCPLTDG